MESERLQLYLGDCRDWLPQVAPASVDAVITDPPYPEISRPYGRLTEAEWWNLMFEGVIPEVRRILKPTGSAVFILQPNSRKVGSMRGWLWEFMAWVCREWNMVQDVWWWNYVALPLSGSNRLGLMRPSVKACVWCGPPGCYRNQKDILWTESEGNFARRVSDRANGAKPTRRINPSGIGVHSIHSREATVRRGGVTPFNLLPIQTDGFRKRPGKEEHGAVTPLALADWWVRYIVPPGGVVCDPFMGSGTMGLAALNHGARFIGMEKENRPGYYPTAAERLTEAERQATQPGLSLPAN